MLENGLTLAAACLSYYLSFKKQNDKKIKQLRK